MNSVPKQELRNEEGRGGKNPVLHRFFTPPRCVQDNTNLWAYSYAVADGIAPAAGRKECMNRPCHPEGVSTAND
ncbi:hypothetical protein [Gracilimonas sp. BCB1]|uniref:hypothetical protein n=1 Tax=Gracilimonas sp. BCB1 TaxID=3152362 RepID=UPI0032D8B85C